MKKNWMIGMTLAISPVSVWANSGLNLSQLDPILNCPQCEVQCAKKAQFVQLTSSRIQELKPVLLAKSQEFEKLSERVRKSMSKKIWEQISEYQWKYDFGTKLAGRYGGDFSPELSELSGKLLKSLWSITKSSAEELGISLKPFQVTVAGGHVSLVSVSSEGKQEIRVAEDWVTGNRKGFATQKEDYLIPNATVMEALGLEYVGYELCSLPLFSPGIYNGTGGGLGMPFFAPAPSPETETKANKAE